MTSAGVSGRRRARGDSVTPVRLGFLGLVSAVLFCACAQGSALDPGGAAPEDASVASDSSAADAQADVALDSVAEAAPGDGAADATDAHAEASADAAADASGDGATDGASDAATDAPNPCANVSCSAPPSSFCENATDLRVYATQGTCSAGACSYASATTPCPFGCAGGGCVGNPCIGVTCASPPSSVCADATHLTQHDATGTCTGGACSYPSHAVYCQYGCTGGVCNGDPCTGVACQTPSASYCQDATHLTVYDAPGTCSGGSCSYPNSHLVFCGFGCVNGQCAGDPCAGVSCSTPPASYCTDASTLRVASAPGTCSGGTCTFTAANVACAHGCANGACQNCATQADCGPGSWCNAGTCVGCSTDQHCGTACTDCSASSKVCQGAATCVQCTLDSQCGPSSWCNAGTCAACDTSLHCGASCGGCGASTPACVAGACSCNETSCGTSAQCTGGACVTCNTVAQCGPTCSACAGSTPVCGGTAAGCQCTASPDSCGGTASFCNAGVCTACGSGSCGNGRCDCGETSSTCAGDCGPPCPTALTIGGFDSGVDGWTFDGFWKQDTSGRMYGGSSYAYHSSYTQNLTYPIDVNLASCGSATLSFQVYGADDEDSMFNSYCSSTDKSERLYVQCSGDAGVSWTNLTPNPWPANQSACATSYCAGHCGASRSFPITAESITLPANCRTATARFRFQATGKDAWSLQSPGWIVDSVRVN